MIKWIPGSEDMFMASFDDGSILVLEKDRDDQTFQFASPSSWADEHFQITKPNKHNTKHNPIAHWRVSQKGITAFAFSPDNQHVAIVGKDSLMRVIDYTSERLSDVFVAYFGGLSCVAWSPDGHYILTGGQDDLVTIWSFKENRIVARCQGHRSWVTGLAFDPLHCDNTDYRFASVGEDCKLLLWDFSVHALHKPKQKSRKLSTTSPITTAPLLLPRHHKEEIEKQQPPSSKRFSKKRPSLFGGSSNSGNSHEALTPPPSVITTTEHIRLPTIHPTLCKAQVPFLQPIVKQTIHPDPCMDVIFTENGILTSDRRGRIRLWSRPSP
ncbi:MAG: WD40-repeat-containing domain protein [Benjaminiella poitrasii]|nr:MAG: WD40-repeat-containing domain protein [Benjaminiella poitrasii]